MRYLRDRKLLELFFILFLGLTPLLWFKGNDVILGHDAGLTLLPVSHFLDRLSVWTERFGFGSDQTYALPGFFIHGFEALVASFGFNLQNIQKIVFIFWFVLPGLSMFYLGKKMEKELSIKNFALPASIFYMFNHFLLQGWFIAERTKFSVYIALPLVIAFLFDWENGKRSIFKTSAFIALTLFLFNGIGSLPLFGGFILAILTFLLFYFIKGFSKERIISLFKLIFFTGLFSLVVNAYWLVPLIKFVSSSYSSVLKSVGGIGGVVTWIDYISQTTSVSNILKLQGIPEWYQNPLHPYSNYFLNNPLLIIIASLLPIIAFLPLFLIKDNKQRKYILFFSFLALVSVIFIAGSHPPFGTLYIILVNFVPGFAAFRTPFYKFASAIWFSYSILIAFTISYFLQRIEIKNKKVSNVLLLIFCVSIILYSFPFLNGSFFDYMKGKRSMRVDVPQYVFDFGKWSQSKERIDARTLVLPPPDAGGKVEVYTWGYWSLSPLSSLLTNAPLLNLGPYMSDSDSEILTTLYAMMKNNNPNWKNLAKLLGIQSFLLRKDFAYDYEGSKTDNPDDYKNALSDSDVRLVKKFGKWEVYDFKDKGKYSDKISIYSSVSNFIGQVKDIADLSTSEKINYNSPLFINSTGEEDMNKLINKIYIKPECINCSLSKTYTDLNVFTPLITRGSFLYPLIQFKNKREEKKIDLSSLDVRSKYYLYETLKNVLAFKKVVDEGKGKDIASLTVSDYSLSLGKLYDSVMKYLNNQDKDNNLLAEIDDILEKEKNIMFDVYEKKLLLENNDRVNEDTLKMLDNSYSTLKNIKNRVDNNLILTANENEKKFKLYSPKDSKYNLLYRANDQAFQVPEAESINIDRNKIDLRSKPVDGSDWYSLGEISLSKGYHEIDLIQPTVNLYQGAKSVSVRQSPDGKCNALMGFNFEKGSTYRVSFKHRKISGSKAFFLRVKKTNDTDNYFDVSGDRLDSYYYLNNYVNDINVDQSGYYYLDICDNPSPDTSGAETVIEIQDINVRKLAVPEFLFFNSTETIASKIDYSYVKKNQTRYDVKINSSVKPPYLIVLKESSNPNWELVGAENKKFVADGSFNGWIVHSDNKNISIVYKPQKLITYGFIVSFIFAASLITALAIKRFKK